MPTTRLATPVPSVTAERCTPPEALITAVTLTSLLLTLDEDPARARTMAFMTLAFAQILHLGNARSARPVLAVSRILANPYALAAVGLSVGLQVVAFAVGPIAGVLRLTPPVRGRR
jgi:Ca2+-transporting ATPase